MTVLLWFAVGFVLGYGLHVLMDDWREEREWRRLNHRAEGWTDAEKGD